MTNKLKKIRSRYCRDEVIDFFRSSTMGRNRGNNNILLLLFNLAHILVFNLQDREVFNLQHLFYIRNQILSSYPFNLRRCSTYRGVQLGRFHCTKQILYQSKKINFPIFKLLASPQCPIIEQLMKLRQMNM